MIEIQRNIPKQPRSIAAVQAVLEATARLLLAKGMKYLTTNHIAELAGVSIGSLYQYFPNKEAIVAKLIEQHIEEGNIRISILMAHISAKNTCKNSNLMRAENIRLVIKEFIDLHSENLELTRILYSQTSDLTCRQVLSNTPNLFTKLIKNMLDQVDNMSLENNFARAYIIANSVDSLIKTTLIEQPELFVEPKFLDELVNLSINYLRSA